MNFKSNKSWFVLLLIVFILAFMLKKKDKETQNKKNSDNISSLTYTSDQNENSNTKNETILSPKELILTEEELENSKLDTKWSGITSNGLSNTYRKKIDKYSEWGINLKLSQFQDSSLARNQFRENAESHFNKTRSDDNGGRERNPFLSQRIKIENIGDSSFCYKFVSPTIEVLYKNYIIECNSTIDYIYQNLSENNSKTLNRSKKIIKKQIEKINRKTLK
jgi:hypothetical protein